VRGFLFRHNSRSYSQIEEYGEDVDVCSQLKISSGLPLICRLHVTVSSLFSFCFRLYIYVCSGFSFSCLLQICVSGLIQFVILVSAENYMKVHKVAIIFYEKCILTSISSNRDLFLYKCKLLLLK